MNSKETGTLFNKRYNRNTHDNVVFTIIKDAGTADVDSKTCNTAVNRILDGCDANNDENPMNWKSGGTYANGPFTYNIAPIRTNRPFPVPKKSSAKYTGVNHYNWHRYNIRSAGWATWDKGQKTLRGNSTRCFGLGLTVWWFKYLDKPDSDGYEWLTKFNSPIATNARCYSNNKVQKWSGCPSDDECH